MAENQQEFNKKILKNFDSDTDVTYRKDGSIAVIRPTLKPRQSVNTTAEGAIKTTHKAHKITGY